MTDPARLALWLVALAALLAAVVVPLRARAEMAPNFPRDQHDWLHRQNNANGVHCCDPGDCSLVQYRIRATGYQAWLRDRWIDIPDRALMRNSNPTGSAVLCISPTDYVWCFWPEVEGALTNETAPAA